MNLNNLTLKGSSIESPYKIFSSNENYLNEYNICSKSVISHLHHKSNNPNRKDDSLIIRPISSQTKDDLEVTKISKKFKSMVLSNITYVNYINSYSNLTQYYTFKSPNIESYPIRKNEKYLPIISQPNFRNITSPNNRVDSFFFNFIKEDEMTKKNVVKKPYGYKYGKTKIVLDRLLLKSNPIINPKEFQNLCETNIFDSEILNQIKLNNIDIYNSANEKEKNFNFFRNYIENIYNIDGLFNDDNFFRKIEFCSKTSIIKNNIDFKLEIISLCFKFYSLGNKEKPQKLYFPFTLLPLFYLLDFQLFKVFLSKIIYYDDKNKCFAYVENDVLLNKIKKYSIFTTHKIKIEEKYRKFISYNKNELLFNYIYDWIIYNKVKNEDNYKCYKLKIILPKIKFRIENYKIKINKHLNKHILANIISNNFSKWEKFILFDLFCNKKFKVITNLIMLNREQFIKEKKIYLNKDPNKNLIKNKRLEFYISETAQKITNFCVFVPYIILILYGEKKKKYQKIDLNLNESKNIVKFKPYWGIINTLLKCMFINKKTNEIFFRLDLLDNINNELFKVIIKEYSNLNYKSSIRNQNKSNLNIFQAKRSSSKNSLIYLKDKDINKTKYKTKNLEISLLECSLKKINIIGQKLESKYYKIPYKFLKCIFSIQDEKDLFNNNFNDISIIGKCIGECSYDILNAKEENIINEINIMQSKANENSSDIPVVKTFDKKISQKISTVKSVNTEIIKKSTIFNRLKTFKISSNEEKQPKYSNKFLKKNEERPKKKSTKNLEIKSLERIDKDKKFNIRIKGEYLGNRFNTNRGKRNINITSVKDLNIIRIKSEFNYFRDDYVEK